jgi:Leucine-rich repeat (LRR) protein
MQRIRGLEACINLVELDLTSNAIATITGLETLSALRKLVLAQNRISQVLGLDNLCSLEHLLLQGNCILTLAAVNLEMLAKLPKLQSLYLQSSNRTEVSSPRCRCPCFTWTGYL